MPTFSRSIPWHYSATVRPLFILEYLDSNTWCFSFQNLPEFSKFREKPWKIVGASNPISEPISVKLLFKILGLLFLKSSRVVFEKIRAISVEKSTHSNSSFIITVTFPVSGEFFNFRQKSVSISVFYVKGELGIYPETLINIS